LCQPPDGDIPGGFVPSFCEKEEKNVWVDRALCVWSRLVRRTILDLGPWPWFTEANNPRKGRYSLSKNHGRRGGGLERHRGRVKTKIKPKKDEQAEVEPRRGANWNNRFCGEEV